MGERDQLEQWARDLREAQAGLAWLLQHGAEIDGRNGNITLELNLYRAFETASNDTGMWGAINTIGAHLTFMLPQAVEIAIQDRRNTINILKDQIRTALDEPALTDAATMAGGER